MANNRFLVIVRAGDDSRHPGWTTAAASRTWDLVVSYFGSDPARYRNEFDRRFDDRGSKWQGLHALLTRSDFWRDYDYVWLPDDDLAVTQDVVDRLFALMNGVDLDLAQPTLDWNSFYSHPITLRWPSFSLRLTNFVEIMAPCFKRSFLEACLPTFAGVDTGWGLDSVWPRRLGEGLVRSAVLDDVALTHTRPVGGPAYERLRKAGLSPRREAKETLRRHGVPPDTGQVITTAIDRAGRFLRGDDPSAAEAMNALMLRDWAAFNDYRRMLPADRLGTPQAAPLVVALDPARLGATLAANLPRLQP